VTLKTQITELPGIEQLIIQCGIYYVGYAVLAAAVERVE